MEPSPYQITFIGSLMDGKDEKGNIRWTPFQISQTKDAPKSLFNRLWSLDNKLFDKTLVAKEALPLFINSCTLTDTNREIIVAKRSLEGAYGSALPAGVYFELNSAKYPKAVIETIMQVQFPEITTKGPVLDYHLVTEFSKLRQEEDAALKQQSLHRIREIRMEMEKGLKK